MYGILNFSQFVFGFFLVSPYVTHAVFTLFLFTLTFWTYVSFTPYYYCYYTKDIIDFGRPFVLSRFNTNLLSTSILFSLAAIWKQMMKVP